MDDDGSQATRGDSSVPDGTANREGFNIATVEREVAKLSSLQEKQAYILSKIAVRVSICGAFRRSPWLRSADFLWTGPAYGLKFSSGAE